MRDYVIFTDSGCDIAPDILKSWNVKYKNLNFRFDDSEKEYSNEEMPIGEFYQKML